MSTAPAKLRLGVAIEETWDFFHEIYAAMQATFTTDLFRRRVLQSGPFHSRINRFMLGRDLQSFLRAHDVVFFEWASELLVEASRLPKTCGIITRLHRYEMYKWVDLVNWDAVDKIILVSDAKQREFCARFPAQAHKTRVVLESVSLDKFTFQPKPYEGKIGTLCHLTPRKRVYDLVLAFAEMAAKDPALTLHIAGGPHPAYGDYARALHTAVEQLGLQDRVVFYGNLKDAWNWYHQIDIFVSNSYSEGLQVAPIEAMASGRFVLSHRWEGAEQLVPPDRLFFTDRELQEKVFAYAALPEEQKQAIAAATREVACERFDVRKVIAEILHMIEETAAISRQAAA